MANISRTKHRKQKHLKIRTKISGTAIKPRLNVFKSNKNIEAQLIDDVAGITLVHASSVVLKLEKGGNIDAATQVGKAMGKKIIAAGIKELIFDRSGYIYHGRIKALADAVREEGVKF
ncbi:50S ribosomal protein L18 [Candidatus Mycoplasma mahonii]|uniref:50S ribosomal protein L18 n=1 Tax=Candidatus Mycoplasma mahonii TaxID=3004105 RepID=UPI0026EDB65C|nr:50S ribosomal protein L18 [Candidatus Mycoplasma mahonii]WKX02238.1 50S ribosomal protein L18 [Candidatus Mycoplasma mahonii]